MDPPDAPWRCAVWVFEGGNSMTDISVVIPAYNAAWSLADTLASVRAQTLSDFEVIIVDDGSTDGTAALIRRFAVRDPRIKVVRQRNVGLAAARNAGFRQARGDYVAFLDSDDIWHPDYLRIVSQALDETPEAPFAYAYSFRFDTQNRLIPGPEWPYVPRHDFQGLLSLNSVGNGSAAMFRRSALERVGGYDASLRARRAEGAEDWKMCLRMAAAAAPVLVPQVLVGYRLVHEGMSQGNPQNQLRAVRTVMADIREEFPATPGRCFANGRTVLNGWLLPSFRRHGHYRTVLRLLFEAYVLNPLWFLTPELRTLHAMKLRSIRDGGAEKVCLSDWVRDGGRPFAYLARPQGPDESLPAQETAPLITQ